MDACFTVVTKRQVKTDDRQNEDDSFNAWFEPYLRAERSKVLIHVKLRVASNGHVAERPTSEL